MKHMTIGTRLYRMENKVSGYYEAGCCEYCYSISPMLQMIVMERKLEDICRAISALPRRPEEHTV